MLNYGNASRNSTSHGSINGLERLEDRRLMSATHMIGSELRVVGDTTNGNDISVSLSGDATQVVVNVNGESTTYSRDSIRKLRITGGRAADHIAVNSTVAIRATISSKGGDDTVTAGSGNDIIRGGAGNDKLTGGAGNDRIYGGSGRDTLDGEAGRNTLRGGTDVNTIKSTPQDNVTKGGSDLPAPVSIVAESSRVNTASNIKLLAQWMKGGLGAGKKVFDATYYTGAQDLRPAGFSPIYIAYDGDLNRATTPYNDTVGNSFPQANRWSSILEAYKRVARAAAGVEDDIPNHHVIHPTYNHTPQMISLDLEDSRFMALDASADPVKRREVISQLCTLIDAMKGEQAANGVESPGVGIFLWPPAFWSGNVPSNNPNADLAQAKIDFAPLVQRVDAFFPEIYTHSDDTAAWKRQFDKTIADCRAADPTKPIYPFIAPHYSHYATPDKIGKPLSKETWRFVTETVLRECPGAVVWGGLDITVGGDMQTPLPWGDKLPTSPAAAVSPTPTNAQTSALSPLSQSSLKREPAITVLQQEDQLPSTYIMSIRSAA